MSAVARIGAHPGFTGPRKAAGTRRIKSHGEMLRTNAGTAVGEISFVEGRLAEAELTHQTRVIARKLEVAGWDPHRSDAGDVVSVGLLTGSVIRGGGWRNSNLLPAVAKWNRANTLGAFGLWLEETPAARRYARYCVITSGVRCTLDELPERLKGFNRKLGKFIEWSPARFDVHVQLVTLEVTFKREEEGVTCHLHANIVYWPQRVLGSERWTDFLDWMREHFEVTQIEDAGVIEEPEEIIKYALKPAEVMQLTADETRQLAETLHRKQLVRTVGAFGQFCSGLRDRKEKVRFDREEHSWVRMQMRSREQIDRDEVEAERREEEQADKEASASEPIENQILYQTLPQARTSRLAESFVGVRNYTATPTTEAGRRNLRILSERRTAFVEMLVDKDVDDELFEEAAASRVHTCTIIPQAVVADWMVIPEERRLRMLRQVGVPEDDIPQHLHGGGAMRLAEKIRTKLERIIPDERHPWASPTDAIVAQAREAARRREAEKALIQVVMQAHPEAQLHDDIPDGPSRSPKAPEAPQVVPGSLRDRLMQAAARRP